MIGMMTAMGGELISNMVNISDIEVEIAGVRMDSEGGDKNVGRCWRRGIAD